MSANGWFLCACLLAVIDSACEQARGANPTATHPPYISERREPRLPWVPVEMNTIRVLAAAGGVGLRGAVVIQNHGSEPAELSTSLELETQTASTWNRAPGETRLLIRSGCDQTTSACRTLVPGGELRPLPWDGTIGDGQCGCAQCQPAPRRTYRVVVWNCDRSARTAGPPFELP